MFAASGVPLPASVQQRLASFFNEYDRARMRVRRIVLTARRKRPSPACFGPLSADVSRTEKWMSQIGKFEQFLTGVHGYFRVGEEASFPWHVADSSVWYSLLVVEEGRIRRYGFTSAVASKAALCSALEGLSPGDEALLLGVWTGSHRTDLFVLEPLEVLAHLKGPKRFDRFKHLHDVFEAELVRQGRSKYLSYAYRSEQGHPVHTSTYTREEIEALLEYFSQRGIDVKERRKR